MKKKFTILAINPGSTTTKIALFKNQDLIFKETIDHDVNGLSKYKKINEQLPLRKQLILQVLEKHQVQLETIDAYSARGGGLVPIPGGTYPINDVLLHHAKVGFTAKHPATLGSQIAYSLAKTYGKPCFVVNPPDVDEFQEISRITGFHQIKRESRTHALNQKEIGIRYGKETGIGYENLNLIIAHLGGGVSITAHQHGRMIDSTDNINGEGPMTPTRSGALPVKGIIKMCYSGEFSESEMIEKITKKGGLTDHLGTSDVREVKMKMKNGDQYAKLIYDSMIYQISKSIGSMAAVLKGKVDAVLLTGGMANDQDLVNQIMESTQFIAPVKVYAGEFELEALASGTLRVLLGEEEPKEYTGKPIYESSN